MFEAARRAYADAALDPRREIDSFVCASEDLEEGTSIFDEYVPDQLGAVQRPVHTVASDGLFALATGVMLIRSGVAARGGGRGALEGERPAHARPARALRDGSRAEPAAGRECARGGRTRDAPLPRTTSGRTEDDCDAVADAQPRARAHRTRGRRSRTFVDARPSFEPLTRDQAARERGRVRRHGAGGRVGDRPGDRSGSTASAGTRTRRRWRAGTGAPASAAGRAADLAYRRATWRPTTSTWQRWTTRSRTSSSSTSTRWGSRASIPTGSNLSGGALGEGHLHEAQRARAGARLRRAPARGEARDRGGAVVARRAEHVSAVAVRGESRWLARGRRHRAPA